MRFVIFLLVGISSCTTYGQTNQRHPQAPAELEKLEFCIGDWEVRPQSQTNDVPPVAKMHGYWAMDGFAIQAEYRGLDRQGNIVVRGNSFRTYDVVNKQFSMKWMVATKSDYTLITGTMEDGDLVSTGKGVDGRGPFIERYRFYDIKKDEFKFKLEKSYDKGRTWRLHALNRYNRVS